MDSKRMLKLIRLFFLIFNLSCIASIIQIYFRIFGGLHYKLFNVFQIMKYDNILIAIPAIPMILMIITISIFLICTRYIHKLIITKI